MYAGNLLRDGRARDWEGECICRKMITVIDTVVLVDRKGNEGGKRLIVGKKKHQRTKGL